MTGLWFFSQNAAPIVRQTFSVKLRGLKISGKSLIDFFQSEVLLSLQDLCQTLYLQCLKSGPKFSKSATLVQ